jgi:predicted enzyme related to lactoylglutathione lyase
MTPNGSLSYLHIPAVDLQRSAAFYRDVLGWDVRNADTPRPGFVDPSGHLGGAWVTNQAPAREPGLLPYMYADRIDDTLAAVTAHGGEVVTPVHEEGNVWVATFTDPAGNVLGLWYDGPRDEASAS